MCEVSPIARAMICWGAGNGSHGEVICCPIHTSENPQASAWRITSRFQSMVSDKGLPGLVAGCRNIPSFINAQPLARATFNARRCSSIFFLINISRAGIPELPLQEKFLYREVSISTGSGNLKCLSRGGVLTEEPKGLFKTRKTTSVFWTNHRTNKLGPYRCIQSMPINFVFFIPTPR